MAKQKETQIRQSITAALRLAGWDVTYHLQGVGCRRGFPDLTAMKEGRQSDYQKEFEQICISHGCRYILARSVKDVQDLLNYKVLF